MNIDEELAKLEAEARKTKLEIRTIKNEYGKEFRKARAHVLYEVGGEWFACYTKEEITPESNFDKIIEDEKKRMQRIFNSVPRCPKCGGLLLKAESQKKAGKYFWYCADKCGAKSVWDKNGLPNFKED